MAGFYCGNPGETDFTPSGRPSYIIPLLIKIEKEMRTEEIRKRKKELLSQISISDNQVDQPVMGQMMDHLIEPK